MKSISLFILLLLLAHGAAAQDEVAFCDSVRAYHASFWDGEIEYCCPVEQMPELIGGFGTVLDDLDYPNAAREAGIEGVVIIQFVVDTTGRTRCHDVVLGLGYGIDEAGLQAVERLRFKPGKTRNKPVNALMSYPITFARPDTIFVGRFKRRQD